MSRMLMLLLLDPPVLLPRMVSMSSLRPLLLVMSSSMDPQDKFGLMVPLPRSVQSDLLSDHLELLVLMVLLFSLAKLKLKPVLDSRMSRMLMLLLLDPPVLLPRMVSMSSLMPLLLVMSSLMDPQDKSGLMVPLPRSVPSDLWLDHLELLVLMELSPNLVMMKQQNVLASPLKRMPEQLLLVLLALSTRMV